MGDLDIKYTITIFVVLLSSLSNADQATKSLEINAMQKLTELGIENGTYTYVDGCWADDGRLIEAHDTIKFEGFVFSCYPGAIAGQLKSTDPKIYSWLPVRISVFCSKYFKQHSFEECVAEYEKLLNI